MGQRISAHQDRQKVKNYPKPIQKEIVEIVYDDSEEAELGNAVDPDDRLTMVLQEAEVNVWQSAVAHNDSVQNVTLFQRMGSRKQKLIRNVPWFMQSKLQNTSLLSTDSTKGKLYVDESNDTENLDHNKEYVPIKLPGNHEVYNNLTSTQNTYLVASQFDHVTIGITDEPNQMISEKGEMMELVHSAANSLKSSSQKNQFAEKAILQTDQTLCPSTGYSQDNENEDLEKTQTREKRRRLWRRVLNQRKVETSQMYASVDTTLADTPSIPEPNHQYRQRVESSVDNECQLLEAEKLPEPGKHRFVIKKSSSISHDQGKPIIQERETSPPEHVDRDCISTEFGSGTISPLLVPSPLDLKQYAIRSSCIHSGDVRPTMENMVQPTKPMIMPSPIKPRINWRSDPRFTEGFENEIISTISGPTCTVTVTAHSPNVNKGHFKSLTLITVKPDDKSSATTPASFSSTLKSVDEMQENGIHLDDSIHPGSDELQLVPECLQMMKHTYCTQTRKRFGLLVRETPFIGGNVTNRTRRKNRRQRPKSDVRTSRTPSGRVSYQAGSCASGPVISHPVHIYTYRFWVACEPWIEQLFKSPLDRRIESIGRASDCRIRLTRKRRRNAKGFRQQMVSIIAPNAQALEKCCKMFDDKFPCFYATAGLILSHDQLVRLTKSPSLNTKWDSRNQRCISAQTVHSRMRPFMKPEMSDYPGDIADNLAYHPHTSMWTSGLNSQFSNFS
ncbi:unnamed protein product [Echinostoma caproni]|uniref:Non-specific serine/threonine protein kinase n=1 Tax=Echinostoma caproni TaxID=27848 RepID=A0A183AER0_9TREM|nr:unnamed protein product [Echinostoma caproni]